MTTWTPARDQRLLLLLLSEIKPDVHALAAKWQHDYVDSGIDDFKPTPIALRKHIAALKERTLKGSSAKQGIAAKKPAGSVHKSTAASKASKPSLKRKRKFKTQQDSDDEGSIASDPVVSQEEEMSDQETDEEAVFNTPTSEPRRISNRVTKPSKIKLEQTVPAQAFEDSPSESDLSGDASNFSAADEE